MRVPFSCSKRSKSLEYFSNCLSILSHFAFSLLASDSFSFIRAPLSPRLLSSSSNTLFFSRSALHSWRSLPISFWADSIPRISLCASLLSLLMAVIAISIRSMARSRRIILCRSAGVCWEKASKSFCCEKKDAWKVCQSMLRIF